MNKNAAQLEDLVVIVTGAAGGIGRAVARLFASSGAFLVLTDIHRRGLESLGNSLRTEGHRVMTVVHDVSDPGSWQSNTAEGLIPVFGDAVDRNADLGGTLASFDVNHPVFEVFKAPRSGDFTSSTFYRYRGVQVEEPDVILASFDDGSVAISERSIGNGRVLVWASTLDAYWNNIPQQPVFLPLAHQLAKYAAGYSESPSWYLTSEAVALAGTGGARLPAGTEVTVTAHEDAATSRYTVGESNGALILGEQGFHDLVWMEDAGERRLTVAANLDRLESDLTPLDADELAAAVRWRGDADSTGESVIAATPEQRENRQAFWWYLLIGVILLLIAETTLSNRLAIARP